jgi:glycosyltransferase involved in cell wall biosynthesis
MPVSQRPQRCLPAWNLSSRSICMRLSVIVPVLNEQEVLEHTLVAIRNGAVDAEIVVVDGGSADNSLYIARKFADQVISAPRGRARQQNYGAERCGGEVLAFAHADTIVPSTFSQDIGSALEDLRICGGWFDVKLDGGARLASLIGRLISLRSRLMRSGTGDQAIFIRRAVFESLGGFPQIPICEDVASCAGSSTPGESPVYGPK